MCRTPSHTHAVKLLFDATSVLQLDVATPRHNSTPQVDASLQRSTLQLDGAVRERIDAGAVRGSINASVIREGVALLELPVTVGLDL
ncbi:uncharacterized protein G2W53_021925 [Senna tora]|uniref:Uncharacterized protein n=1 Tax=Senna tora TaxID=362788 RepID=A0A834TMS5_9FABA|nr:uncharacterized protein G2W53_021925 [Senna tora]